MKILLISGHGGLNQRYPYDSGAVGVINGFKYIEAEETIKLVNKLNTAFKNYDVQVDVYDINKNAFKEIELGTSINFKNYDYVFEIHFNAFNDPSAHGTEIYVTTRETGISVEQKVMKALSKYFKLRDSDGVKQSNFLVINTAKNQGVSAALLETCFITNANEMRIYNANIDSIASEIVAAICEGFSIKKKANQPVKETYPKWKAFGSNWYYYTSADEYVKADHGQWKAVFDHGKKYFVDVEGKMIKNITINASGEVTQK